MFFFVQISSEDGSVSTTTPRSLGYPDFWIINGVQNWTASGEVGYVGCRSGYFYNLKFGETFKEWRGACLIRYVKATLTNGGKEIHAATYWSSGTGYSAFEIVRWGTEDNFCVRRTSTDCS